MDRDVQLAFVDVTSKKIRRFGMLTESRLPEAIVGSMPGYSSPASAYIDANHLGLQRKMESTFWSLEPVPNCLQLGIILRRSACHRSRAAPAQ